MFLLVTSFTNERGIPRGRFPLLVPERLSQIKICSLTLIPIHHIKDVGLSIPLECVILCWTSLKR